MSLDGEVGVVDPHRTAAQRRGADAPAAQPRYRADPVGEGVAHDRRIERAVDDEQRTHLSRHCPRSTAGSSRSSGRARSISARVPVVAAPGGRRPNRRPGVVSTSVRNGPGGGAAGWDRRNPSPTFADSARGGRAQRPCPSCRRSTDHGDPVAAPHPEDGSHAGRTRDAQDRPRAVVVLVRRSPSPSPVEGAVLGAGRALVRAGDRTRSGRLWRRDAARRTRHRPGRTADGRGPRRTRARHGPAGEHRYRPVAGPEPVGVRGGLVDPGHGRRPGVPGSRRSSP